jgi:hypothetical protein
VTVTNKANRIAQQVGLTGRQVQDILDLVTAPTPVRRDGTILRAYAHADMAIKTPEGWLHIPNTDYTPRGVIYSNDRVDGWQVVYSPDKHPTSPEKFYA